MTPQPPNTAGAGTGHRADHHPHHQDKPDTDPADTGPDSITPRATAATGGSAGRQPNRRERSDRRAGAQLPAEPARTTLDPASASRPGATYRSCIYRKELQGAVKKAG